MKEGVYGGKLNWFESDWHYIRRAVVSFEGKKIVLDVEFEGYLYTVTLVHSIYNEYQGHWAYREGVEIRDCSVTCKLYKSDFGIVLVGKWVEESYVYNLCIELEKEDE